MPTHAELSAKLLSEAATFFRTLAEQNESFKDEMTQNAQVFDQMAALMAADPEGSMDDKTHAEMAGALLKDAAQFFRMLGEQNEPIKDQMEENARVYAELAALVSENPMGSLE